MQFKLTVNQNGVYTSYSSCDENVFERYEDFLGIVGEDNLFLQYQIVVKGMRLCNGDYVKILNKDTKPLVLRVSLNEKYGGYSLKDINGVSVTSIKQLESLQFDFHLDSTIVLDSIKLEDIPIKVVDTSSGMMLAPSTRAAKLHLLKIFNEKSLGILETDDNTLVLLGHRSNRAENSSAFFDGDVFINSHEALTFYFKNMDYTTRMIDFQKYAYKGYLTESLQFKKPTSKNFLWLGNVYIHDELKTLYEKLCQF